MQGHLRCCKCNRVLQALYGGDKLSNSPCEECRKEANPRPAGGSAGNAAVANIVAGPIAAMQAKAQLNEVKSLNDTAAKQLEVQNKIAAMNAELVTLNQKQVQLQSAQLDVMQQQKALAEQQLVVQRASALQLQLQTEMMQLNELRMRRQREFKTAAFAIKRETERVSAIGDTVVRALWLHALDAQVQAASLTPAAVEELADKEYVGAVLGTLESEIRRALDELGDGGRDDVRWLQSYAGDRDDPALQRRLADARAELQRAEAITEPQPQKAWSLKGERPKGMRSILEAAVAALVILFCGTGFLMIPLAIANGGIANAIPAFVFSSPAVGIIAYWYKFFRDKGGRVDPALAAAWESRPGRIAAAEKHISEIEREIEHDRASRAERRARVAQLVTAHPQLTDLGYVA
jgi:hypothetical protein